MGEIESIDEFKDKNCVKVVCDRNDNAMYFSREPIPSNSRSKNVPMHKQICVIPFKRDFLIEYNNLPETPLEIAESVDMNRVIENDIKVLMIKTSHDSHAVDTIDDLKYVEKILKSRSK